MNNRISLIIIEGEYNEKLRTSPHNSSIMKYKIFEDYGSQILEGHN